MVSTKSVLGEVQRDNQVQGGYQTYLFCGTDVLGSKEQFWQIEAYDHHHMSWLVLQGGGKVC